MNMVPMSRRRRMIGKIFELPTINNEDTINIQSTEATFKCDVVPGGNAITNIYFMYGDIDDLQASIFGDVNLISGYEQHQITAHATNLIPGSTIYWRVIAENAAGTVMGDIQDFDTPIT